MKSLKKTFDFPDAAQKRTGEEREGEVRSRTWGRAVSHTSKNHSAVKEIYGL